MTDDEFTIPRPRWIVPLAILGALLLFLGVVVGTAAASTTTVP